jgi:hypothetical protein
MTSQQIQKATKLSRVQVNAAICRGVAEGDLLRSGITQNYHYYYIAAEVTADEDDPEPKPSADEVVKSAIENRLPIELAWMP